MSKAELLDAGPEGTAAFRFVADRKYANLNGKQETMLWFVVV